MFSIRIHHRLRRPAHESAHSCLDIARVCALSLLVTHAWAQDPQDESRETTLPLESTAMVDLYIQQRDAERAAALERARIVATTRGSAEPVRSIPEIDLIAHDVLNDFPSIPARFEGAEAGWRVSSRQPPEFFAQRLMARLMRAGFSSTARCPGEEWSGTRGASRVALRVANRAVNVLLTTPTSATCPGAGTPPAGASDPP